MLTIISNYIYENIFLFHYIYMSIKFNIITRIVCYGPHLYMCSLHVN